MISAIALTAIVVLGGPQPPAKDFQEIRVVQKPQITRPQTVRPNAELQELRQMVRKLAARVDALEKKLQAQRMQPPPMRQFQMQMPPLPQGRQWQQFNMQPPRIEMQPGPNQRTWTFRMPRQQFQKQFPNMRQRLEPQFRIFQQGAGGFPSVDFKDDGSYRVMLNGKEIASGKLDPKESRNTSVTVENDRYKVSVNGKVVAEGKIEQPPIAPRMK